MRKLARSLLVLLLCIAILPAQTVVRYTDASGNIITGGDNVNNALRVNVVTGAAGVSHVDDAAFTPAVDDGVPIFGAFDDAAPDSVNEGDAGIVRMSANRNLYSTIRDAAGNERGVNVSAGNALLVDASATTQPISGTVTVGTFPDNEPFNVAQINGVTPLMGNGVTGTGSQRVTIASDNTAFTVNVGTFPDNEPFNLAQYGAVAVGAGNAIHVQPGTGAVFTANHANTTIGHGVKTVAVAGTDEALAGSTAAKYVIIMAQSDNTGYIAYGATGVDAAIATGTGASLAPGDTSPPLKIDNLIDVFIDATVTGDGVRYTYFN
jgi:hypothetical protein